MNSSRISNRQPLRLDVGDVGEVSVSDEWTRHCETVLRRAARREQEWENVRSGRSLFFLSPEHTPERELREAREDAEANLRESARAILLAAQRPSLCQRLWNFFFGP